MIDMAMKNRRMQMFEDMLRFCERDRELVDCIAMSRERTVLWRDTEVEERVDVEHNLPGTKRFVVPCKVIYSEQHALDLVAFLKKQNDTCRIGVLSLSFSSSFGGNVLRGGEGWEETLCRCTTLYPCLEKTNMQRPCYDLPGNSAAEVCVYVPDIVCVSGGETVCERMELKERYSVDVIEYTSEGIRGVAFGGDQDCTVDVLQRIQQEYEMVQSRSLEVMLQMAMEQDLDELVIPISQYMWDGCALEDIIARMKTALQKYIYFFRAVHLVFA